jgi:filamentous hemagglutinin
LPQGVKFLATESADMLNAIILKDNANFSPPYVPGTQTALIMTLQETQFVRVYVPGTKSTPVGAWIMPVSEIRDLTPEQVASKFALPQTPTHIVDVNVPPGQQLRATIANDINIHNDRSLGGNGGGGGVQFELMDKSAIKESWFSNARNIK